ncbi:hypothetical protein D3C76_1450680 [compost metagenome]
MHGTARCVRQGFGHAHHGQAMLERNLFEQMLEQQGLVGQQQRIAVQQVDLELADTHFMHEGVARQAQGLHAAIDLAEERSQAIVGADAERRMPLFATTILAQWRQERLVRVGVGREDKKLKFGRHHRCQPAGCVTRNHRLEQTARGKA